MKAGKIRAEKTIAQREKVRYSRCVETKGTQILIPAIIEQAGGEL